MPDQNVEPVPPAVGAPEASMAIESCAFPGVYLRLDGRGASKPSPGGSGKVNCQFGRGPLEALRIVDHPDGDGTVAVESLATPGVFLRMDASGLTKPGQEGGVVNCQSFAGPYEKFRLAPHPDGGGAVTVASVAFPGVVLRMDGAGVHKFAPEGAGKVNGRVGALSYEAFRVVEANDNWNPRVVDVRRAFEAVRAEGERSQYYGSFIIGNAVKDHIQGMSAYGDYFVVVKNESSGGRGTIVVLERSSRRIVQKFATPTDGYPHPDGGQVVGAYLAQAVENGHAGFVCFYYLGRMTATTPPALMPCRIERQRGAGAAGITDVGEGAGRRHLVAVYDAADVSFYLSNGKLLNDPACAFEHAFTQALPAFPGDEKSKGADNVCLVTDVAGRPFLVGFTSVPGAFDRPVADWASLYAVDVANKRVEPLVQRHMVTSSGIHFPVLDGVAFRWGAGLRVVSPAELEFFCTSRNFTFVTEASLTVNTFR